MFASEGESVYFRDIFSSLAQRSRRLLRLNDPVGKQAGASITELARKLISSRGEASGVALAVELLAVWRALDRPGRLAWFEALADDFGSDESRLADAVATWNNARSESSASRLANAAEPLRQELFRRINLAPGGTAALVAMRAELLDIIRERPELEVVDWDFVHLFSSWFNRGFLLMTRIDWTTPANILEKIIRYEAVHAIRGWDDLRSRLAPADRRCFAFVHPQMPDEPLIFVEVALTKGIPGAIGGLLAQDRLPINPATADTAVFYSISNTQVGLKGISFGNFLIKQVVEDLLRDLPNLQSFVTLSPVPGFARWLFEHRADFLSDEADKLSQLDHPDWQKVVQIRAELEPLLTKAAAAYLIEAKNASSRPLDPVARFHLGNGARLEQIHARANLAPEGVKQSYGLMVNYLYDLPSIVANHEAYANDGKVVASREIQKLLAGGRPARGRVDRQDVKK